jgi:hypothetical protein
MPKDNLMAKVAKGGKGAQLLRGKGLRKEGAGKARIAGDEACGKAHQLEVVCRLAVFALLASDIDGAPRDQKLPHAPAIGNVDAHALALHINDGDEAVGALQEGASDK